MIWTLIITIDTMCCIKTSGLLNVAHFLWFVNVFVFAILVMN